MKYILFPHKLGQLKNGVNKTPNIIKSFLIKKNSNAELIYDIPCKGNLYKNLSNLYSINESCKGKRINIGGDHSMSIATISHSLSRFENLKVIWIDAHADINTTYSTKTNNYHGMPLGFLTGLDFNEKFYFLQNKLDFKNILYIGLRDLDDYEKKIIKTCNIQCITTEDINNNFKLAKGKVHKFIYGYRFHVSLDVDSIDPLYIPSTGTPVPNGIKLDRICDLIHGLIKNKNMINMDLCELNLELGNKNDQEKSLKNTLKILNFK
jgi:arginase